MTTPVTITFLGGLGEIGRNCACLEHDGQAVLLDCGLEFSDDRSPGVDKLICDFRYLHEMDSELVAVVATHGHEDHIGAIPSLLREFAVPIYGSEMTLGLVESKLDSEGLTDRTELRSVADNAAYDIGPFEFEFLPITHSIPHGFASAIHTEHGVIVHSGDFKLDLAPVDGRMPDLSRIGSLASGEGIRLLLSDSTNSESVGWSTSETAIGASLEEMILARPDRRIIVGTFASHLHRVQQIVDAGLAAGRSIVPLGRSMHRNLGVARDLGLVKIPDQRVLDIEDIQQLEPHEVLIVGTGSQAEPRSALSLMAEGESKWVEIGADDTVILSSTPIPGNERRITGVINSLIDVGAEVIHSGTHTVHTTGHGKADELKTLLTVAQPEYFTPVHGEARHLQRHGWLAEGVGIDTDHIVPCRDGDQLVVDEHGVRRRDAVAAPGPVYVHGKGTVGRELLDQRIQLGQEGFVAVFLTVDKASRTILSGPEVVSQGWVDGDGVLDALADAVAEVLDGVLDGDDEVTVSTLERAVRRTAGQWVNAQTARRPPIVPVAHLIES
jgi:ribonuclease J